MKRATTRAALAGLAALTLACGSSEEPTLDRETADAKREVSEARDAISALAARRRQDFRRLAQQRLDQLERRMDSWSERAEEAQRRALTELAEQRDALSERIQDVRGVSEERWEEFQAEVESSLDDLEQRYEELTAPPAQG